MANTSLSSTVHKVLANAPHSTDKRGFLFSSLFNYFIVKLLQILSMLYKIMQLTKCKKKGAVS